MSHVSLTAVRTLVQTSLSDGELQTIVDRIEGMIEERIGAIQNEANTVELTEVGLVTTRGEIFTTQPIGSITSLTVGGTAVTVADIVSVYFKSGYIPALIGYYSSNKFTIVYKPRYRKHLYESVVIDLIRLTLAKTAMRSEDVADEYSYQAPEWSTEEKKVLSRLLLREF